jgi:hypothetical protein
MYKKVENQNQRNLRFLVRKMKKKKMMKKKMQLKELMKMH